MGATQLDRKGRALHRLVAGGFAQEPRCIQMAGRSFFEEHLKGTALEYLEEVYLEGVRQGELYHFVDVQVRRGDEDHELTLFLYYHATSGQGWLFIEPHSEAQVENPFVETPEPENLNQRRAA